MLFLLYLPFSLFPHLLPRPLLSSQTPCSNFFPISASSPHAFILHNTTVAVFLHSRPSSITISLFTLAAPPPPYQRRWHHRPSSRTGVTLGICAVKWFKNNTLPVAPSHSFSLAALPRSSALPHTDPQLFKSAVACDPTSLESLQIFHLALFTFMCTPFSAYFCRNKLQRSKFHFICSIRFLFLNCAFHYASVCFRFLSWSLVIFDMQRTWPHTGIFNAPTVQQLLIRCSLMSQNIVTTSV